ncbi:MULTISPECIES: hypothetical protein [unclassified Haloferax]|uniref:DUF7310 family coiled-coil domain-containing protein n=1 Tax=unclassified Haloferax TaxID=2625095 RepID=UPI0028765C9C|nr:MULTISPECIES: hypothetical protein [unclassified Haloferax]MDS0240649.1 hypothetical protein [Haloferax sp. S2CR25]MDS0443770.1 hypothetical protein [Haloferax sp. S2CR25-2]
MTTDPTRRDAAADAELASPASSAPPAADRTADLAARLDAVERTITDGDADFSSLEDLAAVERRVADLESAVESLTERLDEMDAATQAMRGYLGGVRAVNEDVERRANAALAKAESLESELVDETASPAADRTADALATDAATSPAGQADGAYDDSPRRDETAGTAVRAGRDSHVAPDSRAGDSRNDTSGSRDDPTDRGLAARLRDAL